MEENKKKIDCTGFFGDKRIDERGTDILNEMIKKETVVLNRLSNNRAQLVGCCRFFNNESVSEESLIEGTVSRCESIVEGLDVLAIQDTSEINFQHHIGKLSKGDGDLGPVGNDKDIGFFIHPVLVLDSKDGFPIGFSHIHVWNRQWDKQTKHDRNYNKLPIEEKESYRWIDSSLKSKEILANASSITIIADREGDIYEEFIEVPDQKTHLVIRSMHNRKLYDTELRLFEHLCGLEQAGSYELEIKTSQKKRQPRQAQMEVRYSKVKIAKPANLNREGYPEYIEVYVIEARERALTVPQGEEPVLWRILTTHEITTLEEALKIIYWYTLRWQIEQLFRTLKSQGLDVESSQIERGRGLKRLVIMALSVALILMQLTQERDGKSGKPASLVFNGEELELLKAVEKQYEGKTEKQKNPFQPNSLAWAAWIIARMGGWKGYRKASPPGPITMKRGLQAFCMLFWGWCLRDVCIE
jgi:hypothetical protein